MIKLKKSDYLKMLAHAEKELPNECSCTVRKQATENKR